MIKDRVLIFDGLNVFMRHYIANPSLSDNGEQIGGIVGFYYNLIRLVEKCKPESVIVVWEGGGSKRKRDVYKDYKSGSRPQKLNRNYDQDEMPDSQENRNDQLSYLIKMLSDLPILQIYIEDAEADDAIGYISKYKLHDKNKIIVTGDHDYYQLVSENCILYSPNSKSFITTDKVIEKYGVHPTNFCLAKAIVGDKSDSIPGVPGIGFKTLVKEFGDLFIDDNTDTLFADVIEINENKSKENPKKKTYRNIKENIDLIERNVKLVRLDIGNLAYTQINKIDNKIENYEPTWNNINVNKILKFKNIKSIDPMRHSFHFRELTRGQLYDK